jgi:hypothetical protein
VGFVVDKPIAGDIDSKHNHGVILEIAECLAEELTPKLRKSYPPVNKPSLLE